MSKLEDALEFLRGVHFENSEGKAMNVCILASLSVREFLRRINIEAEVKSVGLIVKATAYEANIPLHTVGVGCNKLWNEPYKGKNWDGHLIVAVPGYIIDPTFGQIRRNAWEWIPDCAVVPRGNKLPPITMDNGQSLPVVAHWQESVIKHNYRFAATWLAYTNNKGWRDSPDYKDPSRRKAQADEMLAEWHRRAK